MAKAEAPLQLLFTILNLSRIDLALYALDGPTLVALQNLSAEDWEQYRPEGSPIREWSAPSEAKADREMSQKLELDPLPPGLYFLAVGSPEGPRTGQLLSVSRSVLILKRAPEQVLVWVVALPDGKPAADSEVTIYEKDGQVLAIGRTDREGVFKSSLPRETGPLLVIAQWEDDVAVCAEEWATVLAPEAVGGIARPADTTQGPDGSTRPVLSPSTVLRMPLSKGSPRRLVEGVAGDRVYAYTDRPIYQPGQEVQFRAIVRHDDDGQYSLVPTDPVVSVIATDEAGHTVYQETLPLTSFGSVNGSFPLSEEASAGKYRLTVFLAHGGAVGVGGEEQEVHFQVERLRRPGYVVSVTTDQPDYVRGDVMTATISANYDFEVPVARAGVSYTLYAASYFPPTPSDDFNSRDVGQEGRGVSWSPCRPT
jgi:uncharacterized protein YfaS (alpha-2-macroglobulin family)